MPPPDPATVPELTPDTINKLIARLGAKLNEVEKTAASDDHKKKVRNLTVTLMSTLHNGVQGGADLGDWVGALSDQFADLAALVKATPGLSGVTTGACFYQRNGVLI